MSRLFPKWPSRLQWRQFSKVLNKKEKIIFSLFVFLAFFSGLYLFLNFYFENTEIKPAKGGAYTEGVIGSPRFINPIYSATSDVDRDLTELIYSGLMKYNEQGEIVPDLAEKYEILEQGKIYEFYLKENLVWSDKEPLTAEDIIFTIETIQNPSFKSPIRASWLGVEVEKISKQKIRFELKNPSVVFLENCTLKILPKHIWQDVSVQNFPLSIYNLKPIGSGLYKLKGLTQDAQGNIKSLTLLANPNYWGTHPNITTITFLFFDEETDLIKSYQKGEIKGFSLTASANFSNFIDSTNFYSLSLPRYFAIFFNPESSEILAEKEVREALNYGTNKQEIIDKILSGKAKIVNSPILPEIYNFEQSSEICQFNLEKANQLLEDAGFIKGENGLRSKIVKKTPSFQFKSSLTVGSQGKEVEELQKCLSKDPEVYPEAVVSGYFGSKTKAAVIKFQEKYKEDVLEPYQLLKGTGDVKTSTRAKLNEICFSVSEENFPLSFSLITVDQPTLKEIALLLKQQWELLGVELEIKTLDISTLGKEVIRGRDYEMLLFGEILGAIPDPFPFWHSSQVKDPGLNLAQYENTECDKLLEKNRETLIYQERKDALEEFQDLLIADSPAVFLYNPDYLYFISKEIKGVEAEIIIDSSKRFSGIENWYFKTKRGWK